MQGHEVNPECIAVRACTAVAVGSCWQGHVEECDSDRWCSDWAVHPSSLWHP